jgi:hypothetical protein
MMFWLSVSFVAGFVLGRINRPWKSINKNEKTMTGGGRMGLLETKAEFLKNTGLI